MSPAGVRLATAGCLLTSLIWLAAILAAPAWQGAPPASRLHAASGLIYLSGHAVCHQRPERSFTQAGHPLPVCARCTGIYAAAPLGCLVALLAPSGRARRLWAWAVTPRGLLAAALPTILTVTIEWVSGWTSAPVRALAGAGLGFAGAGLVCGALAHAVGRERNTARL
jgi:predicted membrane protein DUF2085